MKFTRLGLAAWRRTRLPSASRRLPGTTAGPNTASPSQRPGPHELVLLHGQPGSPADWQQVAARLPARLHAVAPDRPG